MTTRTYLVNSLMILIVFGAGLTYLSAQTTTKTPSVSAGWAAVPPSPDTMYTFPEGTTVVCWRDATRCARLDTLFAPQKAATTEAAIRTHLKACYPLPEVMSRWPEVGLTDRPSDRLRREADELAACERSVDALRHLVADPSVMVPR